MTVIFILGAFTFLLVFDSINIIIDNYLDAGNSDLLQNITIIYLVHEIHQF